MKTPIFSLFLVLSIVGYGQSLFLNQLRKIYFEASYNEQKMDSLLMLERQMDTKKPLFLAYKGAIEVMKAKYSYNPFTQLSALNRGTKMIDVAILQEKNNFEIHFLRFAVEYHIPSFLGMKTHFQEDKQFLLANLSQIQTMNISLEFANFLCDFLKKSGYFTTEELKIIYSFSNK